MICYVEDFTLINISIPTLCLPFLIVLRIQRHNNSQQAVCIVLVFNITGDPFPFCKQKTGQQRHSRRKKPDDNTAFRLNGQHICVWRTFCADCQLFPDRKAVVNLGSILQSIAALEFKNIQNTPSAALSAELFYGFPAVLSDVIGGYYCVLFWSFYNFHNPISTDLSSEKEYSTARVTFFPVIASTALQ